MRTSRVIAVVIGCLLLLPGIVLLAGGGGLGLAYAFGRGDDGYFDATLDPLRSATVAITAEDLTFAADPGSPDWLLDTLDADVRVRATSSTGDVFVGIAREADVDAYLAGIAHDEVTNVTDGLSPVYRSQPGGDEIAPPSEQGFWTVSATGPGTQEIIWEATSGRWAAVVMNADGAPGVAAEVNVGAKAGFVLPLALILLAAGLLLSAGAVALLVIGARGVEHHERAGRADLVDHPTAGPVALDARLDPDLSRWQWLVKWFLAIPHFIILFFLWVAFVALTVVAGVAVLFTGHYPKGIFRFNVGVLRWAWRVSYYATTGGIGTDRYPPFSLAPDADYPADLHIAYPPRLSRGLVLVKWWLLALPHYLIVAVFVGGAVRWTSGDRGFRFDSAEGGGLLGLLVVIAGVSLLFRNRYPRGLFDLIIGLNRWTYRVIAYAALMTDRYPPFRLDQGGSEPEPAPPPAPTPAPAQVDERAWRPEPEPVSR